MDDLIEALTIFRKYSSERWPTRCSRDRLVVCAVSRENVSEEDIERLEVLDFIWDDREDGFVSFRFGGA